MPTFIDIFSTSLVKDGEELCGDKVKTFKTDDKSVIVLSDGLGSGVKAHILATLTSEIISNMLKAEISLEDVIDTVLNTLPICKVRKIAYATFTIIELDRKTNNFRVINFDNPPIFFIKNGKIQYPIIQTVEILNKKISIIEGKLDKGNLLLAISDGVLYAGMGISLNFGWGWDVIANYIESLLITHSSTARDIISEISNKAAKLYNGKINDDATIVGLYARERLDLIMFSGPPENKEKNDIYAEQVLRFDGRRVICGGTTTNIVASWLGEEIEMSISTMTKDLPPIGKLPGVDLVTEGIVTLQKCMEYLKNAKGEITLLPTTIDGAVVLSKELLTADYIHIIAGMGVNETSQYYMKPTRISVRKGIIEELSSILRECNKEVEVEYC